MNDKVLCPWCGAEMIMNVHHDGVFTGGRMLGQAWRAFYRCLLCGARGPEETCSDKNKAEEAARAATLRRYTPPILCETCGEFGWDLPQCRNTDGTKYGRKECKYWEREPTDEERSAAEWEK